jgi:hypothetical protein
MLFLHLASYRLSPQLLPQIKRVQLLNEIIQVLVERKRSKWEGGHFSQLCEKKSEEGRQR